MWKVGSFILIVLIYTLFFTAFIFIDFSKIIFLTETLGLKFNSSGGYVLELPAFLFFFVASAIFLLVAGFVVLLNFRITKHIYTYKSFNLSLLVLLLGFFVLHDIHSIAAGLNFHSIVEIVTSYMQVVLAYIFVRYIGVFYSSIRGR